MENLQIIPRPPSIVFSKNLNGKIIYIRHGETDYNKFLKSKGKSIKYDINYIDSPINKKGEQQALDASIKLQNLNIEIIYISPLYRCLQTAFFLFKNHPNKKNLKIVVHPLLTEVVSGVNNFTYQIQKTKKKFNQHSEIKVDWTLFDNEFKTPKDQDLFFLKYIDEKKEKIQQKIKSIYDNYGKAKIKEEIAGLGKIIVDAGMRRLETLNHLFQRVLKFKNFLKEKYGNELDDNNKKIIIVSHSCFGQIFTSKLCYELKDINDYPKDACDMKNCEAVSVFL